MQKFRLKIETSNIKPIKRLTYSTFSEFIKTDSEVKRTNRYISKDPIIFDNNKSLIFKSSKKIKQTMTSLRFTGILISTLSAYKFYINFIALNPFFLFVWTGCFAVGAMMQLNVYRNQQAMIDSIYLLNDGKRIEIDFLNKSKIIKDIIKIRKPNKQEFATMFSIKNKYIKEFVPLIVENKVYLLAKDYDVINKEILSAISYGSNIVIDDKQKQQKIVNI